MKLDKINAEIVKAYSKKNARFLVGAYDNAHVGISCDGVTLYVLKLEDYIYDTSKLLKGKETTSQIRNIIDGALVGSLDAVLTGVMVEQDKKTLYELKTEKFNVYIDGKFLRNFDKVCTFKCKSPISPVVVYEDGNIAGVIMPVKYKK